MKKATVHFVTGGQRSGKSVYAEKITLNISDTPIYLATSKKWDQEHEKRIEKHQQRRGEEWITIEEEIELHQQDFNDKTVLLDCITLWLTNLFDESDYDTDNAFKKAKQVWNQLIKQNVKLVVVSNEIGMGVVAMDKSTRNFVDLQGQMNQYIAQKADEVTLLVSGIPVKVK